MNQSTLTKLIAYSTVKFVLFISFGFGLGSGSDFYGFDQLAGSSNMDARYIYNAKEQGYVDSYPLYHTSYEAFSTMKRFVDPDFTVSENDRNFHRATIDR